MSNNNANKNSDNKKKILWITRTAVFTALLVVLQALTAGLGNQFVTGSIVNLILIVTTMTCGIASGATVALISPICAKLFGIGPAFWELIPFIALGNLVLVVLWHFIANRKMSNPLIPSVLALVTAAIVKFGVLFLGVTKIAVPLILKIPEPKASVISASFSFPQLITALIGGAVAILIIPMLKKAIKADK